MICPECNEERGCSCTWPLIPEREDKICSKCADKIRLERRNDEHTRVVQANTVPIRRPGS